MTLWGEKKENHVHVVLFGRFVLITAEIKSRTFQRQETTSTGGFFRAVHNLSHSVMFQQTPEYWAWFHYQTIEIVVLITLGGTALNNLNLIAIICSDLTTY